jgi:hypothetical protein
MILSGVVFSVSLSDQSVANDEIRLLVGTDSGFESLTTLYYLWINVLLMPVGDQ